MTSQGGLIPFVMDLYNDPFKWSVVKSIGFFALGITIASECTGLELMPNTP